MPALAIALLLVLFSGCVNEDFADVRSVGPDNDHVTVPVLVKEPVFSDASVSVATLPFTADHGGRILVGDVIGSSQDEIVVLMAEGIAVYSTSGRLLSRAVTTDVRLAGGMLLDADRDGKLDIIVGSSVGSDSTVRIFNGAGKLVLEKPVRTGGGAFSQVSPATDFKGAIAVAASETWLAGPRGVLLLDPSTLEQIWFAPIPSGIQGIARSGSLLLVSTITQLNGEFNFIGVDREGRFGFDAWSWLLALDRDGRVATERLVSDARRDGGTTTWIVPLSDQLAVCHIAGADEELVLVDQMSGEVISRTVPHGRVSSLTVLRGDSPRILVTTDGMSTRNVELYNDQMTLEETWDVAGPLSQPIAAIEPPGDRMSLLFAGDGELTIADPSSTRRIPLSGFTFEHVVTVTKSESTLLIIAASGSSLSIVRVPL